MSGKTNKESEGLVSKVKVKRQIKTIVEDLENILGDLKDVAKELKEVVHEIDTLTSDLQLEEEMTDSSKTDTLNSSSSSMTTTTASSVDRLKVQHDEGLLSHPTIYPTVLTVLKKTHPPLPPPRLTPLRGDGLDPGQLSGNPGMVTGSLLRNGIFPGKQINRELCCMPKNIAEKGQGSVAGSGPGLGLTPLLRHEKSRCAQAPRERVRFSEKVQYHGYCPDCDLQYDVKQEDLQPLSDLSELRLSPSHCCPSLQPSRTLENGGPSVIHSLSPTKPPFVPRPVNVKPQKTILRKPTSTAV